MSPTTSTGSSATDFQPTTNNPQSNVGGGLQPNTATLQPVTTSSDSNVFNQPGINPQAFPTTDSLRVLTTSNEPNTAPPATAPKKGNFALFFVIDLAVLIVIFATYKAFKRRRKTKSVPGAEASGTKVTETANPKLKPKKKQPAYRQKKKSAKKKSRR